MTSRRILLLTLACGLLLAGEATPAPATISRSGSAAKGQTFNAFVIEEGFDGVKFKVDDPAGGAEMSFKRGAYTLTWKMGGVDTSWFQAGQGHFTAKDYEKAVGSLTKALDTSRYAWVHEQGGYLLASALAKQGKPDEALKAIQKVEKDFPRGLWLPKAVALRAEILMDKGDSDGAGKAFATLLGKEKDWGLQAAVLGGRGQAKILRSQKKPAEAAAAVGPLWNRLDPTELPDEYGQIGLDIAGDQLAAKQEADALATFQRLAYAPVGEDIQARAHLGWAKILQAKGDKESLFSAFDHALLAATLRGVGGATAIEGKRLVRGITATLEKDRSLTPAEKQDYKNYASKL